MSKKKNETEGEAFIRKCREIMGYSDNLRDLTIDQTIMLLRHIKRKLGGDTLATKISEEIEAIFHNESDDLPF